MVSLAFPDPRFWVPNQVFRVEASRRKVEAHANNGSDCNHSEDCERDDEARFGSVQGQGKRDDQAHCQKHDVRVDETVHKSSSVVQLLELFVRGKNRSENLIEEGVDGRKHRTNNESLKQEECSLVKEEDQDADLATASVFCTLATDHVNEISKDLGCSEHCTIHPTAPLLHQNHHRLGRVSKGFRIWNVCQLILVLLLNIDLEAHDSIFGQVLVCL